MPENTSVTPPTVTGLDVGVMLLDNKLPRPLGDVGNARTFAYPVGYDVIPGADTRLVVERNADGLFDAVRATAGRLVGLGARAITTCCGFLAIYQRELSRDLDVPVATSSLLQVPLVLRMLRPDQRVIVLTVNGSTLTPEHFASVGVDAAELERVSVVGLEQTEHFYPMIVGAITELDVERAEREVVAAAVAATEADESAAAFVFECTNLPPYADAVRRATGLPVWDATQLIDWLRAGVAESAR